VKPKSLKCDKAMPSGMWSNPTAVYRLIGCHLDMVVLGCEILPAEGKNYISHKTPKDLLNSGSRYSQCHDESMETHVPPSPPYIRWITRLAEMLVFFILKKCLENFGMKKPIFPTLRE
jgi:hypothetical protein